MQPDTTPRSVPESNIAGFRSMTAILAFCANKPTHMGAAYRL